MQECIDNLVKGGKFVLAHKDYRFFSEINADLLFDWKFIHRTLDDYKELIENNLSGYNKLQISFESPQKVIYFGEFSK